MNTSNTPSTPRRRKRTFNTTLTPTTSSSATIPAPGRIRVTQACDLCRQRKAVCDAQKPACARCLRAKLECTFLMPQKKRGPLHGSRQGVKPHLSSTIGQLESSITDPKHPIQNSRLQQSWEAHAQELEQRLWPNPSPDPFSKEVQDHLVEVFFEFCFEDFNCFSPARFLKSYSQGSLSPCLLDAVCAVAARFSNHPAVVTIPPCKSGEPFASRIRSRMGEIVVEVNIDTVHTLVLLGFYEYISGNHLRGYRFEGIAGRMAPELQLHRAFAQRMVGPFTSDEERVTTEIKVRTFARLLGSDCANSAVAGIPPLFDSTLFEPWIVPYDGDWWVESPSARMIGNYREEEPINAAYVHILHKVLRPRPIREFGDPSLTVPILQVAISVWRFINSGEVPKSISAQPSPSNMHPSSPVIVMSALPSTPLPRPQKDQATPLHWRESIPDIQMLDAAAETWKYQLSEEQLPNNAKSSVWRTDINSIHSSLHYYILQISLYRSVLLRAGMAIDSHAKGQDRIQGQSDSTGESGRPTKLDSDPESTEENLPTADTLANKKDKMFLRMAMEKCYNSANEITAIIDQFSERLVKIRGSHLSFSVFIAGTAHVLQLTTSKNPVQVAQAKRGLLSCLRFFRTLEPYWAASKDQAKFLESLLNTHNAKTEKPNDNDLELIHKVKERHEQEEKPAGNKESSHDESSNSTISAALALLEMKAPGTRHHQPKSRSDNSGSEKITPDPADPAATTTTNSTGSNTTGSRSSISTNSATTISSLNRAERFDNGASSAFLITDSGLSTMWREPEKLEALEKATLLSLEKLSFLN